MSIMKNFVKLFVVMLTAAILLGSCDLIEKGGTIIVENALDYDEYVSIVKVENINDYLDNPNVKNAKNELKNNQGTLIPKGSKQSFSFNEDGVYVVTALTPGFWTSPVPLAGGIKATVTLEPKEEGED